MSNRKTPRCHWCKSDAERIDYREVDGITSKIATCNFCVSMSTKYLLARRYKPRPDSIHLDKLIEIHSISYNHIWYEVHVDATEERKIFETFAEYGEVTPEIYKHLEEVISKIDNI